MLGLGEALLLPDSNNSLTSSAPALASHTGTDPTSDLCDTYAARQQHACLMSSASTHCQRPLAATGLPICRSPSHIPMSAPSMLAGPQDPHSCSLMTAASSEVPDELVDALLAAPDADHMLLAGMHQDDMLLTDISDGGMLLGEACGSSASQSEASWLVDRYLTAALTQTPAWSLKAFCMLCGLNPECCSDLQPHVMCTEQGSDYSTCADTGWTAKDQHRARLYLIEKPPRT